jgi:hypothetical protein
MRMVQVSLIGYAAGGAFLSLAYLDLPFYIIGFVVLCDALLRRRAVEDAAAAVGTVASPTGSSPGMLSGPPGLPGSR